jgi:amino acid adenylation domain-containing protein
MIIKKFEEQVERSSNELAVKGGEKTFTYGELNRWANMIAHEIITVNRTMEKDAGQGVALLFEHGSDMISGIIAALKADRIYVPFDISYPVNRLGYMLENSDSSILLTDNKYIALAEQLTGQVNRNIAIINIDNINPENPGTNRKREASGERAAYILYTSGSTGRPKGVVQTHRNVLYYIRNWAERFSITGSDRMTLFSAFTHDGAVQDMFAALLTGACLYPYSIKIDSNPHGIYNLLKEEKITVWHSVPSLFRFFTGALTGEDYFNDIRWVLLGGEPLRPHDLELFKSYFPNATLANVYGQTESSVSSICMLTSQNTFDDISLGKPLDETDIFLVDKDGDIVEEVGLGEIVMASDYIARGYWKDKKTSEEVFLHDDELGRLYMTGDLGRLTGRGVIKIMGRKDHQVKIRGFRVETGEIETALLQIEAIREAAVVPRETGNADTSLCAFIVAGKKMKVSELRKLLSRELPDYMIPTSFVQLESMPFTQSGKLDKKALMNLEKEPLKLDVTYTPPQTGMEKIVADTWQEVLGLEAVGIHDNFFDLGGNSFDIVKINNTLGQLLKRNIPIVKLFEHPTISTLANYLSQREDKEYPVEKRHELIQRCQGSEGSQTGVAVIGMSGRFPGAGSIDEFWENLKNGVESISFFSDEELTTLGIAKNLLNHPTYVKAKGVLEDIEFFDASFFNFTPRDAELMDPQSRIFFECVWEALEYAGYNPYEYNGLIGLYAGNIPSLYGVEKIFLNHENNSLEQFDAALLNQSFSTRIAYKFNLKGPCVSIQTACSTSLVAIHMACRGLLGKECHIALAGGVSISLPQKSGYLYQEGMILSADGHVRTFDARAKGTVFGDGVGCVVLKRLDDALADGDCIHAVVLGTTINNDGYRKVGFTAPSIEGQTDVIKAAHLEAKVEPESIGFIETHGTGTMMGDPVEIEALKRMFPKSKKGSHAIGSVKSNIGHLNTAAGVAGFIKTVLCLKNKMIPPSLNFEISNPEIDFEHTPFYVNTKLAEWKKNKHPLRASISSFGIGGTNAHAILEEAPVSPRHSEDGRKFQLIVLSACTESALNRMTKNLVNHIKANPGINIADVAYTLQTGRKSQPYRRMLVSSQLDKLIDDCTNLDPGRVISFLSRDKHPVTIFMFPGQGSQYVNMGWELYKSEPIFREEMDRCFKILNPLLGRNIEEILYPGDPMKKMTEAPVVAENSYPRVGRDSQVQTNSNQIDQTWITQPLLFVIEYSLARLLMKWGIKPQAMIGHSIGEYTAACLSGIFSLEEALTLVALRGKLIQQMSAGAMISIPLPATDIEPLLNGDLALAAVNTASSCVVSGPYEAIDSLTKDLREKGYDVKLLHISHAFHSKMMEPVLKEFEGKASKITFNKPKIPFMSNLTGKWFDVEEAANPSYWAKHIRSTVRFADGLTELLKEPNSIFIEVGPGLTLSSFVNQHKNKKPGHSTVNLMRHPKENIPDTYYLLDKIGQLWFHGIQIDWAGLHEGEKRYRIPLPTYPFERKYFWIEQDPFKIGQERLLRKVRPGKASDIPGWFYVPSWKRSIISSQKTGGQVPGKSRWLIFRDQCGIGDQLAGKLINDGHEVVVVNGGKTFAKLEHSEFTIDLSKEDDYHTLRDYLLRMDRIPHHILHLSNVTKHQKSNKKDLKILYEEVDREVGAGFNNLLYLIRALGNRGNGGTRLLVFTNGSQEVTGGDLLYPQKSLLLSAVQVIPLEYPGIKCRSIDIDIYNPVSQGEDRLVENLLAEIELDTPGIDMFVAYRNNTRWVKIAEPFSQELQEEDLGNTCKQSGNLNTIDAATSRPELNFPYTPAETGIEKKLADIWQNLFGYSQVGINDDFFQLGGDSLKATAVISKIHEAIGIGVPIGEFFVRPTIYKLSQYLMAHGGKNTYTKLEMVEKKEYYALSSSQKRLFILHQMVNDNISYNIPFIVELEGEIDIKKLEEVFRKIIARHESLRTSFEVINEEPFQKIYDHVNFEIEYQDVSQIEEKSYLNYSINDIIKNFIQPFDISIAPLLRIGLIKTKKQHYILAIDMHHIITDGTSQILLTQDFFSIYTDKELLPLKIQYKDYSEWQQRLRAQNTFLKQEEYWLKEFGGEIPMLELPTDYPRAVEQSFEGNSIYFEIKEEETKALKAMALSEGATLFMVLIACYNILLSKLSGQEEIIVGTPIAGRKHADLEKIIGMFVNTLALKNYPSGDRLIREFLVDVKERTLMAFENQEYQFEELVNKLSVKRDLGRNPLFDIMFVLHNMDTGLSSQDNEIEIENFPLVKSDSAKEYRNIFETAKFDLTLNAMERGHGLFLSFQYCTKLFKKETIEQFIAYFKKIVSIAVKEPGVKISEIQIISEVEKNRILKDFNQTEIEYPKDKTIQRLFEEQVQRTPVNIAVVGPILSVRGKDIDVFTSIDAEYLYHVSYGELNERANRLAHVLYSKGVRPEVIVGIMVERSIEMIVGILGILKSGGGYLPIDADYPEERKQYMLKDSGAKILLTRQEIADLPSRRASDINPKGAPSHKHLLPVPSSSLAYIIFTSGSTGRPKGVMVNHLNVIRLVKNTNFIDFKADDRILQTGALEFDASTFEIWGALLNGLSFYTASMDNILDHKKMKKMIADNQITIIWLSSPLFNQLTQRDVLIFTGIRKLLVGGDVLSPGHINETRRLYPELCIINGYGPTENTTFSTTFSIDKEYKERIPIGKPIANSTAYIVDKNGNLQPIAIAGELLVGGAGVARGYLNRPELTAEKFDRDLWDYRDYHNKKLLPGSRRRQRIYRTGDLARWLRDGNIEFLGRIDHQVKIRGFRIELGEIENRLLNIGEIKDAVVIAAEADGEKNLCAYIVSDKELTLKELRIHLADQLPKYMIPSIFLQIEKIPLTPNGKVDRHALDLYSKQLNTGTAYVNPENDTQEKIIDIWKQVLKRDKIGIHDNYFDLGGTSFDILRINKRLKDIFQVEIPISIMFRFTTVSLLEKFLNNETEEIRSRGEEFKRGKMDKMQRLQKRREGRNK